MANKRDYYETLGVARTASHQEIKSAYRRLAVRYHPDRNPGDAEAEEKFKEAAEAYRVLSDTDSRARYDRFGHQAVGGSGGFGGFDPDIFGDFADILGDFFGFGGDPFRARRRGRGGGTPGADLRYQLGITLEEAAFGTEKTLRVPRLERCDECAGGGSAGGAEPAVCSACGGQGQVRFTQGFFTVARTCPQCGGRGQVITDPCTSCGGDGRTEKERNIKVTIPAGVDTGSRLRLTGEGEHGVRGGTTGDLYVDLVIERHPKFERHGPDVYSAALLTYSQAVLGTSFEVETLHGAVELEVPGGTQHGHEFQLKGKGIPHLGGRGHGDHVVRIHLEVPKPRKLEEEHLELLKRLAELEGKEVRQDKNVLERVRDLFG